MPLTRKKDRPVLQADVEVVDRPERLVAYVRHVGPYAGDVGLFERLWSDLCKWAGPRGLMSAPDVEMLSIYHDNPEITDEDKLRTSICITVPQGTRGEGSVGTMKVAGGRYAVAHFEIAADEYPEAWQAVYAGWLPDSGYQPDDRPAFEICRNDPHQHPEGKHVVDICVPVKPL